MPNIIEITDFHAPELDPYARLTQNQLRNRLEPEKGIFIAESPKVIDRALDAGYKPVSLLMERKQITGPAAGILSRCGDAPVYTADREMLAELTGFELTRGVLCAFRRPAPRPAVSTARVSWRWGISSGRSWRTFCAANARRQSTQGLMRAARWRSSAKTPAGWPCWRASWTPPMWAPSSARRRH